MYLIHQKKTAAFVTALLMATTTLGAAFSTAVTAEDTAYRMNITVDLQPRKEISPYIYGINQYGNQDAYKDLNVTAVRQGGNRMTAYNWETNASNAGSDYKFSSDTNLSTSTKPADCVQKFSQEGQKYGFDYKLTTLQMAGYVAADKDGPVSEAEAAPSDRWNKVELRKNAPFSDTPDLTDHTVYMDEYVNYIIKTLGDSTSATGMQAYSLDNEPALWSSTHSRIHPNPVSIAELSEKSVTLASAVKELDPNAEVFGPALFGYMAYNQLADTEKSDEWETIKSSNNYHWYLDCYLDQMKKAEETHGKRLLDVLDIHYYSESARVGAEDRVQSVRTLYEKGFQENSWIGQWCMENVPILPTVQKSIDTYYPGTKLAISEYNFGGGDDVSGTIAQAEALGCYADAGVYFATLWGGAPYIFSGLKLYTNYNGKNGTFGDTLVSAKTDDVSLSSAYASIHGNEEHMVTAMVTNKSMNQEEHAVISIQNSDATYQTAAVYAVYGDSSEIRLIDLVDDISDNTVSINLPAFSAAMVVVSDDAHAFDGEQVYNENQVTQKVVTIDNPEQLRNDNGFVVLPIEDPEHLSKIIMTADVTSSASSSWATAGCAMSINAKDMEKNDFWTSKSYSLSLGKNSTATVLFDGTFKKEEEEIAAVIADKKIELQQWWSSSEKEEDGVEDVISVTYTNIQIVYAYENADVPGDVNADGTFTLSDLVATQKWLVGSTTLKNWKAGDMNADGILNVFDLRRMKQIL